MKKFIFIMMTLVMGVMSMNAQTVVGSRFFDNTYVGVSGGAFGELKPTDWGFGTFGKSIRGVADVRLGKMITPIFGLELDGEMGLGRAPWSNAAKGWSINHTNVGMNALVNLNNVFHGYKGQPDKVEVVLFTGLGWWHSYRAHLDDMDAIAHKFGAQLNINFGKERAWQLNVIPTVTNLLAGQSRYGEFGPKYGKGRMYVSLLVGATYKFKNSLGTHNFVLCDKVGTQSEWDALNAEINELRARAEVVKEVVVEKEVVREVVVDNTTITNAVGFNLNSDKVADTEYANIANIATWIKCHDGVKVVVEGYADKDTGTTEYNQELATRRAEVVKNILVNTFGVNTEQLIVRGVGSVEQPYDTNNWNRVVIFSIGE